MVSAHHKLFVFLSPAVSLLEEWGWGKFVLWSTHLGYDGLHLINTSWGDFSNSLQGEPVPMTVLKKKKNQSSHGKYTPAGLKQEEKAKLCLKSGRFDPWTFILFPKASLKAVKDQEETPTVGMNTSRWRLIFKTLYYDDPSDYYQGNKRNSPMWWPVIQWFPSNWFDSLK